MLLRVLVAVLKWLPLLLLPPLLLLRLSVGLRVLPQGLRLARWVLWRVLQLVLLWVKLLWLLLGVLVAVLK